MRMTRRELLSAAAALAVPPAFRTRALATPLPRQTDVVVVGAGAAGIAAARRIAASGRSVIVVEASNRVGGRCLTDGTTFEVPFDRGARLLHNPDTNPLAKLARSEGIGVFPVPAGQKIRVGRRNARAGETEEFLATLVRANRAIDDAARGRVDVSCAAALPGDLGDWAATVQFTLGPCATGKDLEDLSAMDQNHAQERIAAIGCRPGLGALLTKLGDGMPVALSTPVSRVIWSGRDVGVETPAGRIAARAVIVTVSSNVLASGHLQFTPELPKRPLDAAAKLSLGSYDRVALWLDKNPLGLSRDDVLIEQSADAKTGLLLANIGGSSLCTIDVAGSFGRDLSAQGERAMVAFATEWLTKLFGSDVEHAIKASAATRWNAEPFVLGAMSAATPGGQPARRVLAEPLGNLFFAGEATHETLWGTVHGAWESGERAADAALKKLGPVAAAPSAVPSRKPRRRHTNHAGRGHVR